jgi:hypothetical protein
MESLRAKLLECWGEKSIRPPMNQTREAVKGRPLARLLLHFEYFGAVQCVPLWTKREMARRRDDNDWICLVAQIGGALLLLSLFSPQTRQIIFTLGTLAVCAVGIAGSGLIGFGICRFVTRSRLAEASKGSVDLKAFGADARTEDEQPPNATDHLERLSSAAFISLITAGKRWQSAVQ